MLRIRKISDSHTPANRSALEEAQAIIGAQFPGMPASEVARLPDQLRNPFKHRFVAKLLVAEDARGHVKALALLQHDPDLAFSYLEVISVAPGGRAGSGIGGALYDRVREEAEELGAALGRASCRDRVCQYVWISVGDVSLKKNNKIKLNNAND